MQISFKLLNLIFFFSLCCLSYKGPQPHREIASISDSGTSCIELARNLLPEDKTKGTQSFLNYVFREVWKKEPSQHVLDNLINAKLWNTKRGNFTKVPSNGFQIIEHNLISGGDKFQYLVRAASGENLPYVSLDQQLRNLSKNLTDPDYLNVSSASLINEKKNAVFENFGIVLETNGEPIVATSFSDLHTYNLRADWKFVEKGRWEIVNNKGRTGEYVDFYQATSNLPDRSVNYQAQIYVKENKGSFDFNQLTKRDYQLGTHKREHEFAAALLENKTVNTPEELLDGTLEREYYTKSKNNNLSWNEVNFLVGPTLNNPKPVAIYFRVSHEKSDFSNDRYYGAALAVAKELNIPLILIRIKPEIWK